MAAKRKYRWEDWFGRRVAVLVRGVDYHCPQSTIVQAIRNAAVKYRKHIRLRDTGDTIIVEVIEEGASAGIHTDPTAVAHQHQDALA